MEFNLANLEVLANRKYVRKLMTGYGTGCYVTNSKANDCFDWRFCGNYRFEPIQRFAVELAGSYFKISVRNSSANLLNWYIKCYVICSLTCEFCWTHSP